MAAQQEAGQAVAYRQAALLPRVFKGTRTFIVRKPLGAIGAFIIVIMVLLAVLAPVIAGDPLKLRIVDALESPSSVYWLGTDDFGRDLWSRIVHGARISLIVGFAAVAFGSGLGGTLGLMSAFYGGKVDMIMQRLMDSLMSIPTLILALAIMASLGQGLFNVVLAIGVVQIPRANRIVRSQAFAVKQSEFALAARSIGAGDIRIMALHIFPQCVAPMAHNRHSGTGHRHHRRGLAELPRPGCSSPGAFLGRYAFRPRQGVLCRSPVVGHLARCCYLDGRLRLQPLWRRHKGRA